MKKTTVLALMLSFSCIVCFAQKEQEDIDTLYKILSATPSFKAQITGDKLVKYNAIYAKLKREIKPGISDYLLFSRLSELILPINDSHIDFSQIPQIYFNKENNSKPGFLENYYASAASKSFPRVTVDLVELERSLALKKRNDIEGIYYNYDDELKIGIYHAEEKNKLTGVVLSSRAKHFNPGDVVMYLQEKGNGNLNMWGVGYLTKTFYLNRSERFTKGTLELSNFKKKPYFKSFSRVASQPDFALKYIDSNIQYLKLTNFMASDANKLQSKKFYGSIKDSLTAPNLIVDVRNNGGGYYSISSQFLMLLRKYANPGNIYLLTNIHTVSNAEQFTIKLKGSSHVTILGQRTMGRIAYGQNYGTKYTLPSGKFSITPTDMGAEQTDLQYEGVGVPVDIELNPAKDWIEQVKVIIREKSGRTNN